MEHNPLSTQKALPKDNFTPIKRDGDNGTDENDGPDEKN